MLDHSAETHLAETNTAGPLAGVRVVDLTSVIMGPSATHMLADLGADVIKIETPEGDSFRHYRPARGAGMGGNFLHLNRNKRSVRLDLKRPAARAALDRLIATADVLVHSMRPDAILRLGYGYERVRALRPDIVFCGAYGFGADGPYAHKAAYDDLIQAGSGLAALQTAAYGQPGYLPTVLCDKIAGQAIACAILAALYERRAGGGGQAVEVPMFETMVEFNFVEHMVGYAFEPPLGPPGFNRVLSPRRKPYRTRDGHACILPYSDRNWRDFFIHTGRLEFVDDPRFAPLAVRVENIEILYALVEEEAPRRTTAEWVAFCDSVSIPCMPVLGLEDLPEDAHLKAVGFFGSAEHPSEGRYRTMRRPVSFSGSRFAIRRHAPRLGEHTAEVLAEAGLEPAEIAALMDAPDKPDTAPLEAAR
ncbi:MULTISPECIES: CoA transferase [Methylobacterium]|uniref:CaiB/BaiF CoA transferase family protein n=1 Tax=Methylobacterium TaxID=407 RepID=UPI00037AD8E1|nr:MULTISPECIES: CoA transferase [Methylobacterium]MBN4093439.1 CoA transferase [Methylobacterium sp. OT2]UIN34177.1 CoA transferase [Methylobacterium oryzae]SEG17701.1 Crotonobetainyl-CoA:carnitine CoA-transferase CaiB [Methylobacterium sp. 190mf]